MGCDIHLHEEVKIKGKWHHYGIARCRRNYRLFAKMADVRNLLTHITPIAQPRGIPKNATELTKFDNKKWGVDGHSHSWIGAKEIKELKEWYEKNHYPGEKVEPWWFEDEFGYLFGNGWDGFIKYPEDYSKDVEDIRFIFWFDN